MVQGDCQYLVRAAGGIVPAWTVNYVIQIAAFVIPEAPVEGIVRLFRILTQALRGRFPLLVANPALEETQGVIPQGVDLYSLTAARGHDPVVYFGIHPG